MVAHRHPCDHNILESLWKGRCWDCGIVQWEFVGGAEMAPSMDRQWSIQVDADQAVSREPKWLVNLGYAE